METLLFNFLKKNKGEWFKKVQLYIIADNAGFSPETCGRALRDLATNGKIKVDYYQGKYAKNLAKYSYNPDPPKSKFIIVNNTAYYV